jgi:hypothetical protein
MPKNSMDKVRDFHALGQRVLDAAPQDGVRRKGVIEQFVEPGVSAAAVFKARRFAALYNQSELGRLCKRRLPDGRPLGIAHVFELLQVADPETRLRLEQLAETEGWSSRRLRTERLLRASSGKAGHGGRKPRLPRSHQELLQLLEERGQKWVRWAQAILDASATEAGAVPPPTKPSALRVSRRLRSALTSVNEAFERLNQLVHEQKQKHKVPGQS